MKKIGMVLVGLFCITVFGVVALLLWEPKADYTTEEFELALNNGDVVEGKLVEVSVLELDPNSAMGYNILAGEHLNFVSAENPQVDEGDTIVVQVEKVASIFGSFIITYKKQ